MNRSPRHLLLDPFQLINFLLFGKRSRQRIQLLHVLQKRLAVIGSLFSDLLRAVTHNIRKLAVVKPAEQRLEFPPVEIIKRGNVDTVHVHKRGINVVVVIFKRVDGGLLFYLDAFAVGLNAVRFFSTLVKPQDKLPQIRIGRDYRKNDPQKRVFLIPHGNVTIRKEQLEPYPVAEIRAYLILLPAVFVHGGKLFIQQIHLEYLFMISRWWRLSS